jgi:hypothetical protein
VLASAISKGNKLKARYEVVRMELVRWEKKEYYIVLWIKILNL